MLERVDRMLGGLGHHQFRAEPAHDGSELANLLSVVLDGKNHRHGRTGYMHGSRRPDLHQSVAGLQAIGADSGGKSRAFTRSDVAIRIC